MVERNDYIVGCLKPKPLCKNIRIGEKNGSFPPRYRGENCQNKNEVSPPLWRESSYFPAAEKTLGSKHEAIDFWRQKIRRNQGVPNVAGILRDICFWWDGISLRRPYPYCCIIGEYLHMIRHRQIRTCWWIYLCIPYIYCCGQLTSDCQVVDRFTPSDLLHHRWSNSKCLVFVYIWSFRSNWKNILTSERTCSTQCSFVFLGANEPTKNLRNTLTFFPPYYPNNDPVVVLVTLEK